MKTLSYKQVLGLNSLQTFLFAPISPLYITIFRVILSAAVTIVFWYEVPLLYEIKTIPVLVNLYKDIFFSVPYSIILYTILILFCLGFRPRLNGFLLCILLLPWCFIEGLIRSRQVILFSLLAFSFIPSRAQYSLFHKNIRGNLTTAPYWPIRLIQLQLSLLYGVNAIAKTNFGYLSGEVLQGMSIMLPNFILNLSSGSLQLGSFIIPLYLLALSSVIIEYILAIGFWFKKTRIATAILGVLFHFSLMWVVEIGMLDWASLFLYASFLLPFDQKDPFVT